MGERRPAELVEKIDHPEKVPGQPRPEAISALRWDELVANEPVTTSTSRSTRAAKAAGPGSGTAAVPAKAAPAKAAPAKAAAAKAAPGKALPPRPSPGKELEPVGPTPSRRPPAGRAAAKSVQRREHVTLALPLVGRVELPHPQDMVYYGGIGALVALELLEWPAAVALAVGHALISQKHNRALAEFGEALEDA